MLVLSRKVGEKIVIGEKIEITLVAVLGDKVRIGITAPRDITVHRKEIADLIESNKRYKQQEFDFTTPKPSPSSQPSPSTPSNNDSDDISDSTNTSTSTEGK